MMYFLRQQKIIDEVDRMLRPSANEEQLNIKIDYGPYQLCQDSYGKACFALKEGNPLEKDMNNDWVFKATSIEQIPNDIFIKPDRSILLPPPPIDVAKAMRTSSRPYLIKKSTFERNKKRHPEIVTPKENKIILSAALYDANVVFHNRPQKRPTYRVVAKVGEYIYLATIDIDENSSKFDVVDWRKVSIDEINRISRTDCTNGGYIQFIKAKW